MNQAPLEFRFDRFAVSRDSRRLFVDGGPVKLGARAFDMLLALIERHDRVVSKNEMLDTVWPGATVEESNLQVHMVALRKVLGPDVIATIPGRGYKFVAPLKGYASLASDTVRAPSDPQTIRLPGNLPSVLPRLYGRDADVAALRNLLEQHRLVSVVGPAGIGKTSVAQTVAHALRGLDHDGVWLIELAPLERPDLVASTVARGLGHELGSRESALATLVEAMHKQRLLLVLDNCEHLANEASALVRLILDRAPGVRLLVTSQEPLRLVDEHVYRLGPLNVPATTDLVTAPQFGAVALFVARASAADTRFALDEFNVSAIVEICARLDGVALAIELAAARVSLLGVETLRRRLDERLRLLASGERAPVARHRTLSAALEWSYGLLSANERTVLDRLGIFVGGFSLESAQCVASDEQIDKWAVVDALSGLVDKSLVMVDPGEEPRYRLLETTRAFALERLAATGATQTLRRRHARALIDAFKSAGIVESPTARIARTQPDIDNLRAAAAWATGPDGDRTMAIELAGEADFLWYARGFNDEGVSLWRAVEPWVDETTHPAVAARFWLTRSILLTLNALKQQAAAAERAASLYRGLGDRQGLFVALTWLSIQRALSGETVAAERALAEAKSILDPAWPIWTEARVEFILGYIKFFCLRQPEAAIAHIRAARILFRREGGDAGYGAEAEMGFVLVAFSMRKFAEAASAAVEWLRRPTASVIGYHRAVVAVTLAAALAGVGDLAASESTFRQALTGIKRATGTVHWVLNHLAFLIARQGRVEDAARLVGYIDNSRTDEMIVQSPSQRTSYDEAVRIASSALSKDEFKRLKAAGARLSEDEAAALALPAATEARKLGPDQKG
jgi:predicted ATPase/DNA-binding winged helix-turn-helix (wHTH) protein